MTNNEPTSEPQWSHRSDRATGAVAISVVLEFADIFSCDPSKLNPVEDELERRQQQWLG